MIFRTPVVTGCDTKGSFAEVRKLVEESIELWHASRSDSLQLTRPYSIAEQQRREELLDDWVERLEETARSTPRSRMDSEQTLARITATVVQLSTCALDFEHAEIERLLRDGFSQVGSDLARSARELDREVSMTDILQACRNAWTACGLQLLLGVPMRLTPAIFGYSMLYPYSDNYLDGPTVSSEAKLRFSMRFRRRLTGEYLTPMSEREAIMWQLVRLIESEYPRSAYPQVHDSLLAIHHAQQQSIAQMQRVGRSDLDVLTVSVTKGGTSVLADAYLAAGNLTDAEARFAFNWGVVLQLSDDLQDVRQDGRRGSLTLFSQAAKREPLDQLTNRLLDFTRTVMAGIAQLPNGSETLQRLLTRSSRTLVIRSAASAPELYSVAYLGEMENYSPFRFGFLRNREQRFFRTTRSYARIFDLLLEKMLARSSEPSVSLEAGDYRIDISSAGQGSKGASPVGIGEA